MEEIGLAASMAQNTQPMRDIDQIVQMLLKGVTPEELIQQGVPTALVQAAVEQISKQTAQVPAEEAGLANMYM